MISIKKIIYFSLLVSLVLISHSSLVLSPPKNTDTPANQSPISNKATAAIYNNSFKQNNNLASSNKPNKKDNIDVNKHKSNLLQTNPSAPEIPYYLLGTTNDPLLNNTWALTKVQANRAWDLSTGSTNITIAVVDTGFALNHDDLTDIWHTNNNEIGTTKEGDACWTGSAEDKQTNHCDDDNNGYNDDWQGYDFINDDNSPQAGQTNPNGDGTHHGSLVAGVIGATANNNIGSTGINHNAKIMPLQVFDDDSSASTTDVVAAVEYAANNGANIINLSLGTNTYDELLLNAIQYAKSKGSLVVVASGNCALNDEVFCNDLTAPGRMTYPALYPEVLAVGSTDSNDKRASSSSYGSQLDIVAPGEEVGPLPYYSSNQTNLYAYASGTSFASPMVAGIAGLLLSQNPNLSLSQLEQLLVTGVDKPNDMNDSFFDEEFGYGRINAHRSTLLGLASTELNLLGEQELSSKELPIGKIWRATSGQINNDESLLIGCRVFLVSKCSVTIQNGQIYRFNNPNHSKLDSIQYIFVKGSDVPSGNWEISVHSQEFAAKISSLLK